MIFLLCSLVHLTISYVKMGDECFHDVAQFADPKGADAIMDYVSSIGEPSSSTIEIWFTLRIRDSSGESWRVVGPVLRGWETAGLGSACGESASETMVKCSAIAHQQAIAFLSLALQLLQNNRISYQFILHRLQTVRQRVPCTT